MLEQRIDDLRHLRPDLFPAEVCRHEAAAAVDVVTNTPRRDDAAVDIKSGHPADRKTVTPVHIGHGKRVRHDPRQLGHVGHLFRAFVLTHHFHELVARVDDPRDAHGTLPRDFPPVLVDASQLDFRHRRSPSPPSHQGSCAPEPGGRSRPLFPCRFRVSARRRARRGPPPRWLFHRSL